MDEYDSLVLRRQRPRHIRELDIYGLLLKFGQIPGYIKEYLWERKQYKGKIEIITFGPENAMKVFGTQNIGGVEINKFEYARIFSKNQINGFLDNLLSDFCGGLPPIGLVFVVPEMLGAKSEKPYVNLNSLAENEENFENPGLFRNAPFALEEKARFCAMLLPLKSNPVYLGRNFLSQTEMVRRRGQDILTAVEISYSFVAVKEMTGGFYPFIPQFLRTGSKMQIKVSGGMIAEMIVLAGENCNYWRHSHGNKPGVRFSTSGGEASMSISVAAALVKVFTDEDIAGVAGEK